MGFYVKDIYVSSNRWRLHDPLTNPPTIPETSPVFVAAKYLQELTAVQRGRVAADTAGRAGFPNPDGDGGGVEYPTWTVPTYMTTILTTTTPVIDVTSVIREEDYLRIRENLRQAAEVIDRAMEQLTPQREQLDQVMETLQSAQLG
jgi:hypothetical protein